MDPWEAGVTVDRWVDLSHPLTAGAPRRPGTPPPLLERITGRDGSGSEFSTFWLAFTSHQGTHLDWRGEPALASTTGPGCLFDLRGKGPAYCPADLAAVDPGAAPGGVLILWTGRPEPVFSHEAMVWLKERAPRAVAVDAGGFAPGPLHQARDAVLMDAGILVLENVTNLDGLPHAGFEVFFFPLVIPGIDAVPVRVVARCPSAGIPGKGED